MRCRLLPVLCSPERLTKLLRRTRREMLSLPPNERWRNAAFTGMKSTACMDRSWNSLFALIKRGLVWQSPDASTWRLLPRLSFCPGRTRPFTFPENLRACVPAWSRRCAVNGFTSKRSCPKHRTPATISGLRNGSTATRRRPCRQRSAPRCGAISDRRRLKSRSCRDETFGAVPIRDPFRSC